MLRVWGILITMSMCGLWVLNRFLEEEGRRGVVIN